MPAVKIGLLGCGTVGGGFVRLLEQHRERIAARTGADLTIGRILVRDEEKRRPGVDRSLLTTRAADVIENGADVVVELIGGTNPARGFIRDSLSNRKHVVTANKAVLAAAGGDLLDLAAVHGVQLRFEASVCGGIPIVRVIRQALAGDRIRAIRGIVNGTSNFVLTQMAEGSLDFAEALALAQERGFAEADPSLDVDGGDAAQKISILARLAFGDREQRWARCEGIREVTARDVCAASDRGAVIKLVASAREEGDHVVLAVGPELLSTRDALANIANETNAVTLTTECAGELLFSGPGAGSLPSAASVLADVIDIAGTWDVRYRGR